VGCAGPSRAGISTGRSRTWRARWRPTADTTAGRTGTSCGASGDRRRPLFRWILEVDAFVVYTDDKSWWTSDQAPRLLLRTYREGAGIDARLVVVAMTAKRVSVADFFDPGMLDVAGFDTTVPALVADCARGWDDALSS
jgi:hypothetical protein